MSFPTCQCRRCQTDRQASPALAVEPATDKPLRTRVAEALGCKPGTIGEWLCVCPNKEHGQGEMSLPWIYRYDTDWSACGLLIERFELRLVKRAAGEWMAEAQVTNADLGVPFTTALGVTPPIAVCNLILMLHAAGRLPR